MHVYARTYSAHLFPMHMLSRNVIVAKFHAVPKYNRSVVGNIQNARF